MKKTLLYLLFLPFCVSLIADEYAPVTSSFTGASNQREPQIIINNCPLAKINGKIISLIDVVKKMDLFLYEYDPNLKLSAAEKVQFYMGRWSETLEEMICNELVLLDAQQKEIKVSDGEVREELEDRFGPNIMSNLEKIGLTYDQAREWIRNDITIRQMMWFKVHSKALQTTTPQVIKAAYQAYLEKNPPVENWTYRVFSIRGKDQEACETLAKQAYALLSTKEKTLEEVAAELKEQHQEITITVSDELSGDTPNISKQHYDVIKNLSTHSFSEPVSQVSRFDKSTVSRVFYLDNLVEKLPSDFDTMHEPLKNKLLHETADKEKEQYFNSLKKRYGFDKVSPRMPLSSDYQPFTVY
ncbi:SurA N-terminal domain-containing protein [Simkania negevensis]|uniref:PpiC domain-containing protein n=1 Tax=Simkania negevensis (strain ATCC VR-1471 / DSM 27360 / Z) TaxID=331113 RepID=F8L3Z2_SIMNZ|nr:SurA N-terminal domain-containing protein [Simkania negevensis]CCB90022.1 putative uncharacterized protein [Simkania negevensis Z]